MRVLGIVPTLLLILVFVFFLIRFIPGDPARLLAGPNASFEDVQNTRLRLGLDKPIVEQFVSYIYNILHGDFGISMRTRRPVGYEIKLRYRNTLILTLVSITWSSIAGVFIGVWSAAHRNKWQDFSGITLVVSGISLPSFWIGFILISLFSVRLKLLPTTGAGSLRHLILPSFTLGLGIAAVIAQFTRSSLLEVIKEDYVRTARAKGAPENRVLWGHAFRNAMISVVTVVGLQFGSLLGGAVVTEAVFAYPGIGSLLIQSAATRDYPMIQALVLIFSLNFLVINLVVDILYVFLNPTISLK
jgi:glutathione transport system permease protein